VARELSALGHDVKQVPPAYAKRFRQGHKNDFRDAHAIAEAVERPSTRCVPVKTDDQLDLQALHRVRSRLIGQRTAVINQIRGFLLEHGIAVRQGLRFLRQQLPDILAKRSDAGLATATDPQQRLTSNSSASEQTYWRPRGQLSVTGYRASSRTGLLRRTRAGADAVHGRLMLHWLATAFRLGQISEIVRMLD
jgi:hypothetical protein